LFERLVVSPGLLARDNGIVDGHQRAVWCFPPIQFHNLEFPEEGPISMFGETPAIRQWSMDPEVEWRGRKDQTARLQNSPNLINGVEWLERVFKHLGAHDEVVPLIRYELVALADIADVCAPGVGINVQCLDQYMSWKEGPCTFPVLRRNIKQ
jgi:hypothetical protein